MKKTLKMKQTIEQLSEEVKSMRITQLIGLGESQRRIYELFGEQQLEKKEKLRDSYKLHQQELELLIKYQNEM